MGLSLSGHAVTIENLNSQLPDFSYAGYRNGSQTLEFATHQTLEVTEFGARANDGKDDTAAFHRALEAAQRINKPVLLQMPAGRFIISDILYLERDNLILRGAGKGATLLYFPRPMRTLADPPELNELREYLVEQNKRQRENDNNINLPYSQYSWSGGFIWTRIKGERVKPYLKKYDRPTTPIALPQQGKKGENSLIVDNAKQLQPGQVITINWYNKGGKSSALLETIYPGVNVSGSHHWNFPLRPLVSQSSRIRTVEGRKVVLNDVLLHDIQGHTTDITQKAFLHDIGIEEFSIEFPRSAYIAHHVEQGFNAIYLTRLFDGWIKNIDIINADSGVLTEEVANVTIQGITTRGNHKAHYTVAMGDTHNVLVEQLTVNNHALHPLSFNTFATKSVYSVAEILHAPVLDQHSGANHQNLFDNIRAHVTLDQDQIIQRRYPLFKGGGAGYWKPTHGADSSFWNIDVIFHNGLDSATPITLYGVNDGPNAHLIGVHGNTDIKVEYGPNANIQKQNATDNLAPSLYQYQLESRLAGESP
ncbi:glycoside hydrolase family 55 protein [Gilvimarinus agarilyticus]|uniref:glycoside hydrolase family 55 protein n=1 Tax=Gilvimarinus sp. 2_MG-2023 TaxID=3062666 RepID=UPI001C0977AC|nr:glycoside hydrolase family 55 protein [Gilvimarinus sp. 2_MG-2023]MBU2886721.1 glycoside hydrolase family 55 protein [Gilvimarinus agarilyticus]MDO6571387.1 glycoside hydrolase family 55 protein [Gilvimarinus sp. 2_MG-2023]